MTEENPDKIKKAEIVVGIPSFSEADTIGNVVEQVDEGLSLYFPDRTKVIINSDNASPDGTREAFLKTKTVNPKIYISTPEGIRGKGNNLRNFFQKIKGLDSLFAMTVDADLKSITHDWVRCLLKPLIDGYDYVTPVYFRHKYDGFITNHLCYPVVYGVLGYDIRQPIGGDFAFSRKLVDYWLEQKWDEEIENYGIDIFMTLNAVKSGAKLAQVDLSAKVHKPSTFKLDKMFLQVVATLFNFLQDNKNLWQKKVDLKHPPLAGIVEEKKEVQKLPTNYHEIAEKAFFEFSKKAELAERFFSPQTWRKLEKMYFRERVLEIDPEFWAEIIYEIIFEYLTQPDKEPVVKTLRALYFGRVASYIKENSVKTHQESEALIREKVKCFFEKRNYLLSLVS